MNHKTANAFVAALAAGLSLSLNGCAAEVALDFTVEQKKMVIEQLVNRDITNQLVLKAMTSVPRHELVPEDQRKHAYRDRPLPIGYGQTISQPYVVAFMTQALQPRTNDVVLEVGTGSGYQAAVLSKLVKHVYSIEIVEPLGRRAETDLKRLSFTNISVRIGDGYQGWPEAAPFDAIIVTCAPESVPEPLIEQLKEGGRMIIPVGRQFSQSLYLLEKQQGAIQQKSILPVRFVPMTGRAEQESP